MFLSKDEDVIFFESARTLRGFPHMVMECVPVDKDSGALAPIYFKASAKPLNNVHELTLIFYLESDSRVRNGVGHQC